MNYIFIGMPGSGKSTFGKRVAESLKMNFLDFDEHIEKTYHKSVGDILTELGEKEFLEQESQLALKLKLENTVFSTSGSLPYSEKAMLHIGEQGKIIYLAVNFEEIMERFQKMRTDRIIGFKEKTFEEIFQERELLYIKYADIIFHYSGNNINSLILELMNKLCPTV